MHRQAARAGTTGSEPNAAGHAICLELSPCQSSIKRKLISSEEAARQPTFGSGMMRLRHRLLIIADIIRPRSISTCHEILYFITSICSMRQPQCCWPPEMMLSGRMKRNRNQSDDAPARSAPIVSAIIVSGVALMPACLSRHRSRAR